MPNVELDRQELTLLLQLLANRQPELIREISHTSSHAYRDELRQEADLLAALKAKLERARGE